MHISTWFSNDGNRLGTKSVRRQIPQIRRKQVLLLLGCIGLCFLDPCEIMRAVSFQLRRWLMMVNDWVVQLSVGFVFFTIIVDSFLCLKASRFFSDFKQYLQDIWVDNEAFLHLHFESFDINLLLADFMYFATQEVAVSRLHLPQARPATSATPDPSAAQPAPKPTPEAEPKPEEMKGCPLCHIGCGIWMECTECTGYSIGMERDLTGCDFNIWYMWIIILIWHVTENGAPSPRGVAIVVGKIVL